MIANTAIVDADMCIKLGGYDHYPFLFDILPLLAGVVYIHTYTRNKEVLYPTSATKQVRDLIAAGKLVMVDEASLSGQDRAIFDSTYQLLERTMIDPRNPQKNRGEVYALAMAKALDIPLFCTDERHLQPLIDQRLNTGLGTRITCFGIADIVLAARDGTINIKRKIARLLWEIADMQKRQSFADIWPL